ncbi:MAG: hypothetical protein ACI9KR_001201, partial [Arcticibacterium sp.]
KNTLGFRNWRLIEDVLKKLRFNKNYEQKAGHWPAFC